MKKLFILIGITLLSSNLNVFSQNTPIEFGVKGGLNFSTLIIDKNLPMETNAKFGFHIGGFLSYELAERLRLKPELLFSTQNTEIQYTIPIEFENPNDPVFGGDFKYEIKESLILIPIMAEYSLSSHFDLEVGTQIGYVVNQEVSGSRDDFYYGSGKYERFEVALNIGAGFNFADNYRIGLRYNYGITKRDNAQSSVLQLGLGYEI